MDATAVALIASIGVNFISLYASWNKAKTAARVDDIATSAAEADTEAKIEDRVIARWQQLVAEERAARIRETASFDGQIKQVNVELSETRKERAECREQSARQEEQIKHLTEDIKEMRLAFRRAGLKYGSSDHEPLK